MRYYKLREKFTLRVQVISNTSNYVSAKSRGQRSKSPSLIKHMPRNTP